MSVADELQKLDQLRANGALSEEEFQKAKERILNGGFPWLNPTERLWAFFLHLSLLSGYILPLAGFVAPIIIWQIKKDEYPSMDTHGRHAANWMISHLIYAVISAILVILVIGFPMLVLVGILAVVFPVIAAIKAYNGETWKYPLSIQFFSTTPQPPPSKALNSGVS